MSNADVDVLIVGAGLTGAMIAAQLAERGARVGIVDAQRVGQGATARALGVAVPDPSSPHLAETARGMDLLRALADRLNIKLQSCISLHTSGSEDGAATLQRAASEHPSMRMEWMAHPELLPAGYNGGLLVHDSALVDLDRLLMRLLQHPRITVRQHAEITKLELNGQNTYAISRDGTFSAGCVVLATNAYVGLLSPYLADSVTVARGSTFTSRSLRDGTATKYVMPTLIDGGRLMLSPGKDSRVNAAAWQVGGNTADPYETLRTFLRRTDMHLFEQAENWRSGVTTLALDGAPLVGRLDTGNNGGNVLYALGLGPFGLAWGPIVAEKVSALAV